MLQQYVYDMLKKAETENIKAGPTDSPTGIHDPEAFAVNLARTLEEGARALSAYLKPREEGKRSFDFADGLTDVVKTLTKVAEYWLCEPERTLEAQNRLLGGYFDLWATSMKRMMGDTSATVAEPDPKDKRFADPEWSSNPFFSLVKQVYLVTSRWAERMVDDASSLDPHTRQKAAFYIRQLVSALAPSNFVLTNPELLRETLTSDGANLVRGMRMLAEDIKAGGGDLKIRQTDTSQFVFGKNIATTPGKVVHQNNICQLIQYAPMTDKVLARPLLIVPPWINKFYILDLNEEKSFVRWCLQQGHSVFVVSWVNPDERQATASFGEYMREGILESVDAALSITGADGINAIGYCVGGTLLSVALASAAAKGDDRIKSMTLFASQVDFTNAGDLSVFADEDQIVSIEKKMTQHGYLESRSMAGAFNMLRPNELIWPYVIANYFKGKEPGPFDLLFWNSDTTRMPAANHSFYLRNCYLNNNLSAGRMEVDGVRLDLRKVKTPIYNLATREDHIAPARSAFYGSSFFGGDVTFVLSGSGHIAGVVNPPARKKYQFWTGAKPAGDRYEEWLKSAVEHPGSWWPHWQAWIEALDARRVPAPGVGNKTYPPIEDAPGSYVRVRA